MDGKRIFTGENRLNMAYRPQRTIFPLHPIEHIINEIKAEKEAHQTLQIVLINPYLRHQNTSRIIATNLVESQINLDYLYYAIRRKDQQIEILQQFLQDLIFRL